jgi:hypothetical protein
MRHSWSVAVLLVLAAVAGYAAGTRPLQAQAQAQAEALPFNLGQTVELGFDASHSRKCLIAEVKGTFVRCRNLSPSDRATRWINIAQVAWVTTGALSGEGLEGRR